MTLDQVIEYERKQEKSYRHDAQIMANVGAMESAIANIEAVAKIHEQIADYLEELKSYRLHIFSGEQTKVMIEEERNKAIDDFAEKLKAKEEELFKPDYGGMCDSSYERSFNNGILALDEAIDEIAEQLKESESE